MPEIIYHHPRWELGYVTEQLLSNYNKLCTYIFVDTTEELCNYRTNNEVYVLVFSSNVITFAQLQPVVLRLKPKVLIHLSDEYGTRPEYTVLDTQTNLILRQHRFPNYPATQNTFQIPLGYMTGYYKALPPHNTIGKKDLVWSFVGTLQRLDRQEMAAAFLEAFPNGLLQTQGGVTAQDMAQIYARSIFVPNGRGCVRLDCFRLTEAALAYAIPVVVGSKDELEETFYFEGKDDFPPFVCAKSWTEATEKCKDLLTDKDELYILQKRNYDWVQKHWALARERIAKAIH